MTPGPTAGSNAGRGIRYQDLVGAAFAVRALLGEAPFGEIVPEGGDDFEIRNAAETILVDAKSNRPTARARSPSEDAKDFRSLWTRDVAAGRAIAEYWLVVEATQGEVDAALTKTSALSVPSLKPLLNGVKAGQSFLVVEPDPLQVATQLLVDRRKLAPITAHLIVLSLAHRMGELASENGPKPLDQRRGVSASEVELLAARIISAVESSRLERLIHDGFLDVVDFTTPLNDPGFYLGVDVQPGHFAAGLALERPDAIAQPLAALEGARTLVLVGPSGVGKSSLMWNCALATRANRRWFRVTGAGAPDDAALIAFFRAYAEFGPIGFVVDDIGRGRTEVWARLAELCASHPHVWLLGSARAEDTALLPRRHASPEINVVPNDDLAEALWRQLAARGQTSWAGWQEPWSQSNGLLLEYGHILTQGRRLDAVISDQINRRLTEHRDVELQILAHTAPAAAHGGAVAIEALQHALSLDSGDLSRALARLVEEHLIRIDAANACLTGLHALRAMSICTTLDDIHFADRQAQARAALQVASLDTLESVILGVVASGWRTIAEVSTALAARLADSSDIKAWTIALRGCRLAAITLATRTWTAKVLSQGLAPKLATMAAMLGVLPAGAFGIPALERPAAIGRELMQAVAEQGLPPQLVAGLLAGMQSHEKMASAAACVSALSTLAGAQLDGAQIKALSRLVLPFDTWTIDEVVSVFDGAHGVTSEVARAWSKATASGAGKTFLERLATETPFALPITSANEEAGRVMRGDLFEAAAPPDRGPNDTLAAHCHAMLMLDPGSDIGHSRLVDLNCAKTLHLDAEKRIPRENSPSKARTQWTRRVLDAVAMEVGAKSWSAYLEHGRTLLRDGAAAFVRLLNCAALGITDTTALDQLNSVVGATDFLIAPANPAPVAASNGGEPLSGRHLTPLQNIIFSLNAPLVVDFAKLPEHAAMLAQRARDLIKLTDQARQEPWSLIGNTPKTFDDVDALLRDIEIIALESAASGLSPRARWSREKKNGKPKGTIELYAARSRTSFRIRIGKRRTEIAAITAASLPNATIITPTVEDGIVWPTRFLAWFALPSLDAFKEWTIAAPQIGTAIASRLAENEDVSLAPVLNGKVACDYCWSAKRSTSFIAEHFGAAGVATPFGGIDADLMSRLPAPKAARPPAIDKVFLALRDVAASQQFGFATPGRSPVETARIEAAMKDIELSESEFLKAFDGIDLPFARVMRAFYAALSAPHEASATELNSAAALADAGEALAIVTWRSTTENPN